MFSSEPVKPYPPQWIFTNLKILNLELFEKFQTNETQTWSQRSNSNLNPKNAEPNHSMFLKCKLQKISNFGIFEDFDSTFVFNNTLYDSFRVQNNDANCKLHNIIASAASVSFREVSNTPFWNCPYCVVGDVAAKKRDWNRTVVVKCQKK